MSKSVLISTMHRGNNYGSALQVFALSEFIKQLGVKPIVLDYIPKRINEKNKIIHLLKQLIRNKPLSEKYQALRGIIIAISSYGCYNSFFKKNLYLTKKYHNIKKLQNKFPIADIYMTGSDQVWNSVYNQGIDPVFFLSFVPNDKTKVSYSASFGRDKLEQWEIDSTKKLLDRYDFISVRELSGLKILRSIGITDAKCVLDPTFLLDHHDWRKRLIPHKNKEKYVLIYSVEPEKKALINAARILADKIKAKVYMVEWGKKPYSGVDKMISLVDPLKLIDYFDKAEFVIASSFHGTALSINLHKQFISFSPNRFNTRVKSILEITELEDRLIELSEFSLEKALVKIDYTKVDKLIEPFRNESINYLRNIFK